MQALVPCVAGRQRIVEPRAPGSGREPQRDRHRQLEASHDKAPTSDEPPLDSGHKKSVYSPLKEMGGQSAYIYRREANRDSRTNLRSSFCAPNHPAQKVSRAVCRTRAPRARIGERRSPRRACPPATAAPTAGGELTSRRTARPRRRTTTRTSLQSASPPPRPALRLCLCRGQPAHPGRAHHGRARPGRARPGRARPGSAHASCATAAAAGRLNRPRRVRGCSRKPRRSSMAVLQLGSCACASCGCASSAPAPPRLLRLLRPHLAALGGSALPGERPAH